MSDGTRDATLDELLPVLDDLDRAIAHLPPDLADHPWARGVFMIASRLQTALGRIGVEPIGTVGEPFDPRVHEAISLEPRAGIPSGHIAEVIRAGYRAGDRLVRPAQVVVAADATPSAPSAAPSSDRPPARLDRPSAGPGRLLDERM